MASLRDLFAGLVHEINTPIGVIHASADVSERTLAALDDFRNWLVREAA